MLVQRWRHAASLHAVVLRSAMAPRLQTPTLRRVPLPAFGQPLRPLPSARSFTASATLQLTRGAAEAQAAAKAKKYAARAQQIAAKKADAIAVEAQAYAKAAARRAAASAGGAGAGGRGPVRTPPPPKRVPARPSAGAAASQFAAQNKAEAEEEDEDDSALSSDSGSASDGDGEDSASAGSEAETSDADADASDAEDAPASHDTETSRASVVRGSYDPNGLTGADAPDIERMRSRYDARRGRVRRTLTEAPPVSGAARPGAQYGDDHDSPETAEIADAFTRAEPVRPPSAEVAAASSDSGESLSGVNHRKNLTPDRYEPRFDVTPIAVGDSESTNAQSTVRSGYGTLTLAATPIGNLSDMSPRLVDALRSSSVVYCEDTSHSQTLMAAAKCLGRDHVYPYHAHSPKAVQRHISTRLANGDSVLYVSDSGMPGVSDPGSELVAMAYAMNAGVDVLPGPSAVTTAVALSGLHAQNGEFMFLGYFPRTPVLRSRAMERLGRLQTLAVFFEAPHRIEYTLEFLSVALPANTSIVVCREMTKRNQIVYRGKPSAILEDLPHPKGEFVILIPPVTAALNVSLIDRYRYLLSERGGSMSPKQAIRLLAQQTSTDKRTLTKQLAQVPLQTDAQVADAAAAAATTPAAAATASAAPAPSKN